MEIKDGAYAPPVRDQRSPLAHGVEGFLIYGIPAFVIVGMSICVGCRCVDRRKKKAMGRLQQNSDRTGRAQSPRGQSRDDDVPPPYQGPLSQAPPYQESVELSNLSANRNV